MHVEESTLVSHDLVLLSYLKERYMYRCEAALLKKGLLPKLRFVGRLRAHNDQVTNAHAGETDPLRWCSSNSQSVQRYASASRDMATKE